MNSIKMLVISAFVIMILSFVGCNSNNDLVITPGNRNITFFWKSNSTFTSSKAKLWFSTRKSTSAIGFYPGNQTTMIDLPTNFKLNVTVEYSLTKPQNWVEVQTLDTALIPINVIPGKPRNVSICTVENIKRVCFETPTNILNANTANDKSVEYRISICHYNPLTKTNSKCKLIGIHLGDGKVNQIARFDVLTFYTGSFKDTQLWGYERIDTPENSIRDMAAVVEPFALNGIPGEKAQFNIRFNASSKPYKPHLVYLGVSTAQEPTGIEISYGGLYASIRNISYRIKYQVNGTNEIKYIVTNDNALEIDRRYFKNSTTYIFQVAIDDSTHGASDYSDSKTVTTPVWYISNSSSMLKVNVLIMAMLFLLSQKVLG